MPTLIETAESAKRGGFVHIRNYTAKTSGEVAHHTVNGNVSYKDTLARAIKILSDLTPETILSECVSCTDIDLAKKALKEQSDSFEKSWKKLDSGNGTSSNYSYLAAGVAVLPNDSTLYIWGLGVSKDVITPGTYPVRNSRPKTKVKDWIRRLTPVAKFKRFQLTPGTYDYVAINGERIR